MLTQPARKDRFGIWDLGFGIWDLGFGIWDLGFGIWDLGFFEVRFVFLGMKCYIVPKSEIQKSEIKIKIQNLSHRPLKTGRRFFEKCSPTFTRIFSCK